MKVLPAMQTTQYRNNDKTNFGLTKLYDIKPKEFRKIIFAPGAKMDPDEIKYARTLLKRLNHKKFKLNKIKIQRNVTGPFLEESLVKGKHYLAQEHVININRFDIAKSRANTYMWFLKKLSGVLG